MRVRVAMRSFLLLIFLITQVHAQQGLTRDPYAVAALAQSHTAMGGSTLGMVRNITIVGEMKAEMPLDSSEQSTSGTFTLKILGTENIRVDFQIGSKTISQILSGKRGFDVRDGKASKISFHAMLNRHSDYLPVLSEAMRWNDTSYQIVSLGSEDVNGIKALRFRVENTFPGRHPEKETLLRTASGADLYVDPVSLLVVKRTKRVPSEKNLRTTLLMEYY